MDSLANYGSDGDNSNNSDDTKMPCSRGSVSIERRASDANYDPVQMDMSEESNNNNSSGDSESERAPSPINDRHRSNRSRRESSRHGSSPTDQRRPDHENRHSSNSRDDNKHRGDRNERDDRRRRRRDRSREIGANKSARSSHDVDKRQRRTDHSRDSRDTKRSRDDERKSSRDDDRRRERKSASSCRDERNEEREKDHHHRHHRDEKRDRSDRERSEKKDHHRRDRERRGSRDERTKERNREERTSREEKEKARTRSRSRSKERPAPQPFNRVMSYREEKGRSKLAQLEKLGIELKAPAGEPIIPVVIGEPDYYNPLATATQGKYAEQIQKRKLLWANKSKQEEGKTPIATASTANTWMGTTFTHDQDGKVTAKFKRLMGIKGDMPSTPQPGPKPDILKKQEEMFNNMEQQYEVARATTHTQRGVGLGYATGGYQFPR